jgi:hypothetical protein
VITATTEVTVTQALTGTASASNVTPTRAAAVAQVSPTPGGTKQAAATTPAATKAGAAAASGTGTPAATPGAGSIPKTGIGDVLGLLLAGVLIVLMVVARRIRTAQT